MIKVDAAANPDGHTRFSLRVSSYKLGYDKLIMPSLLKRRLKHDWVPLSVVHMEVW